jgi:hypothetical protein
MPNAVLLSSITDRLPDPPAIRSRLSDLAAEADFLRALLRLLEKRECGRHLMQRRRSLRKGVADAACR